MPRAAVITLLVAFILNGHLQAQRAGGTLPRNAAGVGARSDFVGQDGSSRRFIPRREFLPRTGFQSRFHLRHNGFGSIVVPYFYPYEEPFGYEESYAEAMSAQAGPPVVTPQQQLQRSQPLPAPPAKPQVIELPGAATSAPAAKPLPPTVFILKNRKRLEARRYVLTASQLSVTVGPKQRTIPLDMVDIDATITANRERGINLRIPADRNEISLSF